MNSYDTTTLTTDQLMALAVPFLIGTVIGYILSSFLLMKIFKKAGVEGWKAWVPIYNQYIFLELGGQKGWLIVLLFLTVIPIVGIVTSLIYLVFNVIAAHKIGEGFGKGVLWTVIYFFIPIVWYAVLAFDSSTWHGVRGGSNSGGIPSEISGGGGKFVYPTNHDFPEYPRPQI